MTLLEMFGNGNWQLNLTGTWKFFSHAVMHLGIPFPLCCQYCLPFLDLLSDGTLNSWKFATTKEFYESFIYFPWWVLNTSDCAAWSLGLKRVRSYSLIIFATVSLYLLLSPYHIRVLLSNVDIIMSWFLIWSLQLLF